jgi:hypothetical protein
MIIVTFHFLQSTSCQQLVRGEHRYILAFITVKQPSVFLKMLIIIIIQLLIIYVSSQQMQGQLQAKNSVHTGNYIMEKHNIKSRANYKNV